MSSPVKKEFKGFYAQWAYAHFSNRSGEVTHLEPHMMELWGGLSSVEQAEVEAEVLSEPLTVPGRELVDPDGKSWPLMVLTSAFDWPPKW